ncbi:hypothetical protein ACFWZT_25745 [Streptomyces alboflavus]|uniref:hypothetical protein n=1 Tax=Streptomyces alboflavus TaxID=67267 RepID=UPI00368FE323
MSVAHRSGTGRRTRSGHEPDLTAAAAADRTRIGVTLRTPVTRRLPTHTAARPPRQRSLLRPTGPVLTERRTDAVPHLIATAPAGAVAARGRPTAAGVRGVEARPVRRSAPAHVSAAPTTMSASPRDGGIARPVPAVNIGAPGPGCPGTVVPTVITTPGTAAGTRPQRLGQHALRSGKDTLRLGKHTLRRGQQRLGLRHQPARLGRCFSRLGQHTPGLGKHPLATGQRPLRLGRRLS